MQTRKQRRITLVTTAATSAAAVVLAWATESVSNDIGVANIGLMLALICVAAALADWFAGTVTSVFAALSLNFFHTAPVHSLRINRGAEAATVLLLLALGALVSVASAVRLRRRTKTRSSAGQQLAAGRLNDLLGEGGPALLAWQAALGASSAQLDLLEARLVASAPPALPFVSRSAADGQEVVLPEVGAAVPFADGSGRVLVVRPQQGLGPVSIERSTLLEFADRLEASVGAAG